jgi:hypothetical protein|tara:strand:- start:690 stop:1175 length:486 start_codon:yes stop_codon:yes gene_type:complete
MSADPVTMMIISGVIQGVGTYSEIQASKRQGKLDQEEYELNAKANNLKGLREENDRRDMLKASIANNKAIQAGAGYADGSLHFLNIQDVTTQKSDKDISTIRLNTLASGSSMSIANQQKKVARKSDQFGGWVSIASTGMSTKAKVDQYRVENPKKEKKTTA